MMRHLLFGAAVIVGVGFGGLVPATAAPLAVSGLSSQSADATLVEDIGWRRQYRRYGYPVPYAYYPPAYGYYAAPPAYAYAPPAYDSYAPPPAAAESYAPPPAVAEGDYSSAEGEYGDYPPRMASIPRTASMASIRPRTATEQIWQPSRAPVDRSGEAVIDDGREHAGHHVEEVVAVKRPQAGIVGVEDDFHRCLRRHQDRIAHGP